jgi:hypothetical protein
LRAALRHPALSTTAAVGALFALTWPLLVFDRPLYVVVAFFVNWALTIGLLYLSSHAPEEDAAAGTSDPPPSEDALDRRR